VYFSYLKLYAIYFIIVTSILMPFWKISNTWWDDDIRNDELALNYRHFLTSHRTECCKLCNLVLTMYFSKNILFLAYHAILALEILWSPKQHLLFLLCYTIFLPCNLPSKCKISSHELGQKAKTFIRTLHHSIIF